MTLLVLITLAGFAVALVLGGSLAGWRVVRVHWWLPALGALALQLFLYNPPIDTQPWAITWGPYLFILAKAVMLAVLLKNAFSARGGFRYAWVIAAVGVALNLTVIAANGGYMPQSAEARLSARGATLLDSETMPRLHNVKPIDDSTKVAFLGDVVAQPTWIPRANVISVGDLFLAGGLGLWAFQVTFQVRRSHPRRTATADS